MRTGRQANANIDRFGRGFSRQCRDCALHVHPELVALLTQHESGPVVGQDHVVEIGLDGVGRRNLGHRAMIASMPAIELILVTRTANLRADVTGRAPDLRQAGREGGVRGGRAVADLRPRDWIRARLVHAGLHRLISRAARGQHQPAQPGQQAEPGAETGRVSSVGPHRPVNSGSRDHGRQKTKQPHGRAMVTFARECVTAESSLAESRAHLETTTAPNSGSAASRSEALRVAAGFNPRTPRQRVLCVA